MTHFRIDDAHGNLAGVCNLAKPSAGMSQLAAAAHTADLAHLERMRVVEHADRRPAAILMADLEASSPLARRLSTARYFAFVRGLIRACGPLHRRCRWHCRPPRRRRRRRVLPRRDGRLRIRRREIEHRRRANPARLAHRHRRAQRDPSIRAVTAVRAPLGCDPVHRANPHRRSQRSHRARRRSKRDRADRSLRDRRPDTRLQIAHRTTRPGRRRRRSGSTRAASPTPNSPTSTPQPTRHAETHPPSPSATSTTPTPERAQICRSRARVDCATRSLTRAQNNGRRAGVRRDERASPPRVLHRSIRRSLVHVADSAARWR